MQGVFFVLQDGANAETAPVGRGDHTPPQEETDKSVGRDDPGAPNNTAPNNTAPQCITMQTPLPLLKRGAEGGGVWSMQTLITARGYDTLGTDGIFGANTEDALVRFQSDFDLEADGECGCLTWEKLIKGG